MGSKKEVGGAILAFGGFVFLVMAVEGTWSNVWNALLGRKTGSTGASSSSSSSGTSGTPGPSGGITSPGQPAPGKLVPSVLTTQGGGGAQVVPLAGVQA